MAARVKSNSLKKCLTIIVTAYGRRKYIEDAVKSVLNQTLDRKKYEIIVTKNFPDEEIDSFLEHNGVTSLLVDDHIGAQIVLAAKKASSEVLVFLEDDDLFKENKLESVKTVFDSDDRIDYYHNEAEYITERGEYASNRSPFSESKISRTVKGSDIISNLDFKTIRNMYSMNSCIAVKRSLILDNENILKSIRFGLDNVLFFTALKDCKLFFQDSKKLTFRRLSAHSASSMSSYPSFLANSLLEMQCLSMDKTVKELISYEAERTMAVGMISDTKLTFPERIDRCRFIKAYWHMVLHDLTYTPLLVAALISPKGAKLLLKLVRFG